jgi:hypothetical protein
MGSYTVHHIILVKQATTPTSARHTSMHLKNTEYIVVSCSKLARPTEESSKARCIETAHRFRPVVHGPTAYDYCPLPGIEGQASCRVATNDEVDFS